MNLTSEQYAVLEGAQGRSARKAMEILAALGAIYGAERMIPVASVQISGVSYDNLGEAGLEFLSEMADGGGRARVLTTLNPAGMDIENWLALGISPEFAAHQERVIAAFERMGVITTCTCTPYLVGNLPRFGEHIAWAESSAVCYANSVIGARTNREGGPSALAAALTGLTPEYGFHLDENRRPGLRVAVQARLETAADYGALGKAVGQILENRPHRPVPYLTGLAETATLENLKSLCASLATFGGAALFHARGVTPEAERYSPPEERIVIDQAALDAAWRSLNDATSAEIDFVSLGCPHLSIQEIAHLADLLRGKKVTKTFWITTARPTRQIADRMGYTQVIEEAGAIIAADTCCVVSPIQGRFDALATDSAKACYYAAARNHFKTRFLPFDEVVGEALK
ncbi:MAG TPA: aconitase X catalytic domain-containing protein [Anaerolineaceae bacterium]|nr:aconitase X catalytic domain-containing protein [Anaerolineaceae bacterium]